MPNHKDLSRIAETYGSPFYVLHHETFVKNLQAFRAAFEEHYPKIVIGYSYKTNYIPYLCQQVRDLGGYAEVVSRLEYDLALRIGQDPRKIIFNGPVKKDEDIFLALSNGSHLNIDSFGEMEAVRRFARENPDRLVRVGLRINIPLVDEKGVSHIQEGIAEGRFGFPPASLQEISAMVAGEKNLRVHALHGHTSSTCRSLWAYETITRNLCDVAREFFRESVDYINVGGGLFGKTPPGMGFENVPSYGDYAQAIAAILKEHPWAGDRKPTLVLEPGMALTADILSFYTQVYATKCINGRQMAVVDGNIFHIKPTMHKRNNPYKIIQQKEPSEPEEIVLDVVGSTCMEKDILLREIRTATLSRGDYVRFDYVGAYTVVMTPPFIHPAPAIIAGEGAEIFPVRRRQTLDDIFGSFLF